MSNDKTPEAPWTAWVEARYALADLEWAEGRLDISPAAQAERRERPIIPVYLCKRRLEA
jgi:hypothetical protein